MGSVACSQDGSSRWKSILAILEMMDTNRLSHEDSRGDEKAGDVHKMCRSLGMEKEWQRMVKASCDSK